MDNDDLLSFIACSRFKTARRRKRLLKCSQEKRLLAIDRTESLLYRQARDLPLVPLEEPYQRGWVRSFRLREDVARSSKAVFFETLLTKINTSTFCIDRDFRVRKRRKQKGVREVRPQWLRSFYDYEFFNPRFKLTDQERVLFHNRLKRSKHGQYQHYKYYFNEPWRYVLHVKPYMITHKKLHDAVLASRMAELRNHIERNNLRRKIMKLRYGRDLYREDMPVEKRPCLLKNKPLHRILEECYSETI